MHIDTCYTHLFSILIFSLVAGSAIVASGGLGDASGPLDPSGTVMLTSLGNHLLAEELSQHRKQCKVNEESNLPPPPDPSFLSRIPAHFRRLLGRAYCELNLLHDEAITMSYFNQTCPQAYPDPEKCDRALLLLPTEQLLDLEIDRVSGLNAFRCGRTLRLI